jgi:hypothetical protein
VLRFSKSGAKAIEDAYSRHYKWNQSAEKKRKAIEGARPERAAALEKLNCGRHEKPELTREAVPF